MPSTRLLPNLPCLGAVLRDGPSERIAAQPLWPSHQAGPHPSRLMAHGRASDIEIRAASDPKLAARRSPISGHGSCSSRTRRELACLSEAVGLAEHVAP